MIRSTAPPLVLRQAIIFRLFVLSVIAACAVAIPAVAQATAPTTTAFDGTYVGVSKTLEDTDTGDRNRIRFCSRPGLPSELTIVNGVARSRWGGPTEGSVSAQVLVMRNQSGLRFDGQIDSHGNASGRWTGTCSWQLGWQKAPAPTMPFDGDYVGVSREPTGWGPECPPNGVPAMLIIRNSAALELWEGSVSPQGSVTLQYRRAMRVDAQIDPKGTVKGEYKGSACTATFVWRKQSR